VKVRVEASARLHLGMLDLNGDLGRKFGSLGVSIAEPRVVVEAAPAPQLFVDGLEQERAGTCARRFLKHYRLSGGARLTVRETIPSHVGLGSGTQLALAVATALARLYGVQATPTELACAIGRGRRSGIGIGTFERGGFVLDAGQSTCPSPNELSSPPLLFQRAFPQDWVFVVVVPSVQQGLNGAHEETAFQNLPPPSPWFVGQICRLVLMKLLPALIEQDIENFGDALTQVQRLVGKGFAPVQGNVFAEPILETLVTEMLNAGAKGAGQSSWGPAVYGLVEDPEVAQALEARVRSFLGAENKAQVFRTAANNRGHVISIADLA
jgi:beta-ribofuranosylaminobenzene 5'-phosphate synthase